MPAMTRAEHRRVLTRLDANPFNRLYSRRLLAVARKQARRSTISFDDILLNCVSELAHLRLGWRNPGGDGALGAWFDGAEDVLRYGMLDTPDRAMPHLCRTMEMRFFDPARDAADMSTYLTDAALYKRGAR